MAWNGPINGDYSKCNFAQPPWTGGVATLTHEECIFALETIENEVRPQYQPQMWEPQEPSDFWLQSEYNKFVLWEKGINGDTYAVLKGYNPEIHSLGINESGIVQPDPVEIVEVEPPTEEGE
jgi:hypothetical protein